MSEDAVTLIWLVPGHQTVVMRLLQRVNREKTVRRWKQVKTWPCDRPSLRNVGAISFIWRASAAEADAARAGHPGAPGSRRPMGAAVRVLVPGRNRTKVDDGLRLVPVKVFRLRCWASSSADPPAGA